MNNRITNYELRITNYELRIRNQGMKIEVNGKNRKAEVKTLEELMTFLKYDLGKALVSVNGNVVEKDKYSKIFLSEGDKIDVFSFVGGG